MGWERVGRELTMLSPCIHLLIQFILHQIATILEEFVIVLRRLWIHSDNIVYYIIGANRTDFGVTLTVLSHMSRCPEK